MAEHINSVLRTLVDQYERTQRDRIRHGNHLSAIDRGDANEGPAHRHLIEVWHLRFQELEKLLEADIKFEVKNEPIYDMLKNVKGIGPILAAKMVAQIDISRAPTVSALWRYSGYGVVQTILELSCGHEIDLREAESGLSKLLDIYHDYQGYEEAVEASRIDEPPNLDLFVCMDAYCPECQVKQPVTLIQGEREHPRKGQKLSYNIRLKTACYLAATSFLKANSPYRIIYDRGRAHYRITHPEWTAAHQHLAAMRKMTKTFLSHLWHYWRSIEGLPTRALYVHEYLHHTTEYHAIEFGWPELRKEAA